MIHSSPARNKRRAGIHKKAEMKVKILKPATGMYKVGVAPGNVTEIPNTEKALRMIETGHAEAVETKTRQASAEKATSKKTSSTRKSKK